MHEINAIQTLKRTKGNCYCKKEEERNKTGEKNNENSQQVSNCRNDQQNYGLSKTGKYHAEFHTLLKKNPQCK